MVDMDKVAFALERFITSEIGIGITWFMVWLIADVLFYVIWFSIFFIIVKPLVNAICERIKDKK